MDAKKAVVIVCRRESIEDFREIAYIIRKFDPTIAVSIYADFYDVELINQRNSILPHLVISLVNPLPFMFKTNFVRLEVKRYSKVDEQLYLKNAGLPYLPIEKFEWGIHLNREIYGDYVVLKPENLNSTGSDINLVPTDKISKLSIGDFPKTHLIHKDSYLVQKFIKTGVRPIHYRATVFLNKVILTWFAESVLYYPTGLENLSELLAKTVASNKKELRTVKHLNSDRCNELAVKVSMQFPFNPIMGVDIVCDALTNELYVLELNSGGNVWHFSSREGHKEGSARKALGGRQNMINQYDAFTLSAKAIINKVHELI